MVSIYLTKVSELVILTGKRSIPEADHKGETMTKIYQHVQHRPDNQVGRIDSEDGRVYREKLGPDAYIGRVDIDSGKVYRHQRLARDEYLGRVTEDGRVFLHQHGPDHYLGRVQADGDLFLHVARGRDIYLGKAQDMQHLAEGGAALLLFFLPEDEPQ